MIVGRDEYDASFEGFPEEVVLGEVSRVAEVAAQEFALQLNLAEQALQLIAGDPFTIEPLAARAALESYERRTSAERTAKMRAALGEDELDFALWEGLI